MISKELIDYIRQLTADDKKTLSQKALKAAEEVGELAKCVLPYDNAHGTTHRFIQSNKILEEVCDTMLTVMSVAYELGFSDDEVEQMLMRKANKWADVQSRSGRVKYPIPYEIHITVEAEGAPIEEFKKACEHLNVKPILLDLHLQDGAVFKDLMTSSVHMGNNRSAYEEMERISYGLDSRGWDVIRNKIETVPWHPMAPSIKHVNPEMPPNCYFESHLNVMLDPQHMEHLAFIAENFGAKRSRNIFKKLDDGLVTVMITYRLYDGPFEDFKFKLEDLKKEITKWNYRYQIEKEIIEFSIYDSKVSHDAAWIIGQ